jgi:hypothetical protein
VETTQWVLTSIMSVFITWVFEPVKVTLVAFALAHLTCKARVKEWRKLRALVRSSTRGVRVSQPDGEGDGGEAEVPLELGPGSMSADEKLYEESLRAPARQGTWATHAGGVLEGEEAERLLAALTAKPPTFDHTYIVLTTRLGLQVDKTWLRVAWESHASGGTVGAFPRRLSARSVLHGKSSIYGDFVRVRRALNDQKRRFPARAVRQQRERRARAGGVQAARRRREAEGCAHRVRVRRSAGLPPDPIVSTSPCALAAARERETYC